jgi:VWFA-related protein
LQAAIAGIGENRREPSTEEVGMRERSRVGIRALLAGASIAASTVTAARAAEAAQDPATPPAGTPVFSEHAEVEVVNFEVVVSDPTGVPVRGLTAADFEILRGGEPVPIVNFYAVEGGRASVPVQLEPATAEPPPAAPSPADAPPPQPPTLIVFVDQTNLSPASRQRAARELRAFLDGLSLRSARVGLVTWDRTLKVRIPLGDRVAQTGDAIEALVQEAPKGDRFDVEVERIKAELERTRDDLVDSSAIAMQIRSYTERRLLQVRASIGALVSVVEAAAGIPGAKAVAYVGDGLPVRPGEPLAELWAQRFSLDTQTGRVTIAARNDVTEDLERLVTAANRARVTFYPLYAALPTSTSRGSAAATSGPPPVPGSYDVGFSAAADESAQEPLRELASATGGRVALSTSAWLDVLGGWGADLADHYSLGIAPAKGAEAERRVEVRVRREGLVVRHRRSVAELGPDDRLRARTAAALLFAGAENPLGIGLRMERERLERRGVFTVPLGVTVPIGNLLLVPNGDVLEGRLTLFAAARDAAGNRSPDASYVCPVRILASEAAVARSRTMVCGTELRMSEGRQLLAVSVRDDGSLEEATVLASLTLPTPTAAAP